MKSMLASRAHSLLKKIAYVPPQAPPMDPAAMGGAPPPQDPGAMAAGGMPPMDPMAMMGGGGQMPPPQDPNAAAGGAPPMDFAAMLSGMAGGGGAPPPPQDPNAMPPTDPAMMGGAPPMQDPNAMGVDPFAKMDEQGNGNEPVVMVSMEDLRAILKEAVEGAKGGAGKGGEGVPEEKPASDKERIAELEQQIQELQSKLTSSANEPGMPEEPVYQPPNSPQESLERGLDSEIGKGFNAKSASDPLSLFIQTHDIEPEQDPQTAMHLAVLRRHKGKQPSEW